MLPVVVLKDSALAHNAQVMADYCRDMGVFLAPHGKTHMSPQLARRQLDAGAWAITVATVGQARVFHAFGVKRILIANQVVDEQALRVLAALLYADRDLEVFCLVDSAAGIDIMDHVLGTAGVPRPVHVLVELGISDGRTGCRSISEAVQVAAAARGRQALQLVGVECYEGIIGGTPPTALHAVDALLQDLRDLAETLDRRGHLDDSQEIIVSAGGSVYLDRVVQQLALLPRLGRPLRTVLRCGSYLTHDHGINRRLSPFGTRLQSRPTLRPACELWARVISTPEPGLAIVGFGKRDAAYDLELPMPLATKNPDGTSCQLNDAHVVQLNDQHAYLSVPAAGAVHVGDVITFGMSHPCTIFDKWTTMPVVDDDYRVTQLVQTYF
jgi:D-serine deaminase-like pyridoxal phosphate-dependent protein